jgi:hypothetical protein
VSLAIVAVAAVLLSSPQARHWSGRLAGGSKAAKVSFDVSRNGRQIKRFQTTVAAFCVGPTIGTNRLAILVVSVPRARVRSNGRFSAVYHPNGKDRGEYRISGTLRGNRVRNGRVGLTVATCGGRDRWTARRASR